MLRLGCLWNRSRLERYTDGALTPRAVRGVEVHLHRCPDCRVRVESLRWLRALVHAAVPDPGEPDWSGFWAGVHTRLLRETPRPMWETWWGPLWKPFWGHPRLAMGCALAAILVLSVSLWPAGENDKSVAWAAPVVVQDATTPDPDRTVMVYSSPDQALTVIWLFTPEAPADES